MPIFDIFSKRQKRLRGETPDVYTFDSLPNHLRVQIVHIWAETLGVGDDLIYHNQVGEAYRFIVTTLQREYGVFQLHEKIGGYSNSFEELQEFFLTEKEVEKVLDAVELSFFVIDKFTRTWNYLNRNNADEKADDAITELNVRFKEHGIGFQFNSPNPHDQSSARPDCM